MDSISSNSSAALLAQHAGPATDTSSATDSASSDSPSSYPSTTSSLTSARPTPDVMSNDQSKDAYRSREPIIELPAPGYVRPDHEDDLTLEPNTSDQQVTVTPESNVSNQEALGGEPTSRSPEHERLFLKSQEVPESSVAVAVHEVSNHGNRNAATLSPRSSALYPVNMTSEESSYTIRSDSFGQDSREQAATGGLPDRQQAQFLGSDELSVSSWRESNTVQASNPSARDSESVENQWRASAVSGYPLSHYGTAQPVVHQGPRDDAAGITFNTVSYGEHVSSPSHTNTLPPLEASGSHWFQDQRSHHAPRISLPPLTTLLASARGPQGGPGPSGHPWDRTLPEPNEFWRVEAKTVDGSSPGLTPGPTRPLGPAMKPFDDATSEAIAQRQYNRVLKQNRRREAGGQ